MKIFFLIILSVQTLVSVGQKKDVFDYAYFNLADSIDDASSFDSVVESINTYGATDKQKLYILCGWFFNNIDFAISKLQSGDITNNYQSTFESKKGLCGDYSVLFAAFCERLNIKNHLIEGYVPEYDSDNSIYYDTNHMWNSVFIDNRWYHCDLLGTSGFLDKDSITSFVFTKKIMPLNFLVDDDLFLEAHIPADPLWQLRTLPYTMESFVKSNIATKKAEYLDSINYVSGIESFLKLSQSEQKIVFADNANVFNPSNHNIIVINNYNEATDLFNAWRTSKQGKLLSTAKHHLLKAKKHIPNASGGVMELKKPIEEMLEYIKNHKP